MKFDKVVESFKEYLESCRFSDRTVETYGRYAKRFCAFIETYYPRIPSFDKITKDIILDYQSYLTQYKDRNGRHLSNATQNLALKALRKLFCYLIKRDMILRDPTAVVSFAKEEQRLIRNILSEKEMFDLLEKTQPREAISIRNRAIVELFYATGMRTSELCNLRVHDIDLKEQTAAIINGKGGKSRLLPIGQYAAFYIQLYLEKARKRMLKGKRDDPGYLFLSQRGNPFDRSTINKTVIKSVTRDMKLKKPISAYSFRHSAASHMLANKVDIMYIAKMLGHASLNTTQKYLHVEIGDLKRMHSLYHPREQKEKQIDPQ